jgi:hypothetical protein
VVDLSTTESKESNIIRKLTGKLEKLPKEKLREVEDFADFLLSRKDKVTSPDRGSPEALLEHFGRSSFENGELNELLGDIQDMREMELQNHE